MGTYYYYVNALDTTYRTWAEYGSSPFLGAIDYNVNYVKSLTGVNKREGVFDFPNAGAESSETIDKVYLEVYHRDGEDPDYGYAPPSVYVYDGSTWTPFACAAKANWAWDTIDISSKINTWAKVNACRAYLACALATSDQASDVDCMRLKVTTVTVAKKQVMDGFVFVD